MGFFELFLKISVFQLVRYVLFTSVVFFIFWIALKKWSDSRRIQNVEFKKKDILREVAYSVPTSFIFAFVGAVGWSLQKTKPWDMQNQQTVVQIVLQLLIITVFHDTYFYWMHRAVHHPKLMRTVHGVHHQSTNPSPFAAYAFHPLEAVLEIIWILPLMYFFNFSALIWFIYTFLILIVNIVGHIGFEIYPERIRKSVWGKSVITPTDHNHHHKYFNGNYGLYFSFWDRLMGTYLSPAQLRPMPRSQN